MKYGYVRDSLGGEQHIKKQIEMIGEVDVIIQDTDKSNLRDLAENKVRSGDSIHVSDLNRITRKIDESFRLYEYLSKKGVELYINGENFKSQRVSDIVLMIKECE